MMKNLKGILVVFLAAFAFSASAQTPDPDPTNNIACPNGMNQCCQVHNACNGPYYGNWNYDPDFSGTGGCNLSCAPIDSGVLFILIGGGLFGAFMLNRRRELELVTEAVKS
jgi:hypothetical protein